MSRCGGRGMHATAPLTSRLAARLESEALALSFPNVTRGGVIAALARWSDAKTMDSHSRLLSVTNTEAENGDPSRGRVSETISTHAASVVA